MKRTKLLSIALIAVMALTVVSTASVLTAPKAAAVSQAQPIIITYEAGKSITFKPKQFNYDTTLKLVGEEGKAPILQTFSRQGSAFTLVRTTKPVSWASAYARVGVEVSINGAPSASVPVTVTVNGKYTLNAWGDSHAVVWAWTKEDFVFGTDTPHAKAASFSGSNTNELSQFFWIYNAATDTYTGQIYCEVDSYVTDMGLASTSLSISSIVITFA
jgi:hypothetical protein